MLGWTALERGDAPSAARLLGGSRRLFEPLGLHLLGFTRLKDWSEDCARRVEDQLGTAKFRKEFDAGLHMDTEDLIAFALGKALTVVARPKDDGPFPLTPREKEIAARVAEGKTNREIAAELVISQRTVDGHVERILTKLGVGSRTKLALIFSQSNNSATATPEAADSA